MNRRAFSRQIGSGLSAVFALARTSRAAASRTENKQWAHEHLKGMENTLRPSFSPDFKSLDEDGIRGAFNFSSKRSMISRRLSCCTEAIPGCT
jgi:hypothetical protein